MMQRAILLLACLAVGAQACSQVYTHSRLLAETTGDACHYNHARAGRDWPEHDKECSWTCGAKSQSPINLPAASSAKLRKEFKANTDFGVATNLRVLNIGHAVQVEFDSPKNNKASVVYFGDSVYTMYNSSSLNSKKAHRVHVEPLQFHFHATSEHLLSGRSTQLELHIVTKMVKTPGVPMPKECRAADKACLAVFGVLFDIKTNPTAKRGDPVIQKIINNLPVCEEAGRDCKKDVASWALRLQELLPNTEYMTYTGSLTTPPCTEGVMWHVFPTVKATMTQAQALDLQLALSTAKVKGEHNRLNNRQTQPWNGRTVFHSV